MLPDFSESFFSKELRVCVFVLSLLFNFQGSSVALGDPFILPHLTRFVKPFFDFFKLFYRLFSTSLAGAWIVYHFITLLSIAFLLILLIVAKQPFYRFSLRLTVMECAGHIS